MTSSTYTPQTLINDRVILSHCSSRERCHGRRDSVDALGRLPALGLRWLDVVFVVVLQLQATGQLVHHRIMAVTDLLIHRGVQQKFSWMTQVMKGLRNLHSLALVQKHLEGRN